MSNQQKTGGHPFLKHGEVVERRFHVKRSDTTVKLHYKLHAAKAHLYSIDADANVVDVQCPDENGILLGQTHEHNSDPSYLLQVP